MGKVAILSALEEYRKQIESLGVRQLYYDGEHSAQGVKSIVYLTVNYTSADTAKKMHSTVTETLKALLDCHVDLAVAPTDGELFVPHHEEAVRVF